MDKLGINRDRRPAAGTGGGAPSVDYGDPSLEPCRRYIMFATNDPDLDAEMHATRRGIETGHRMIENARPKTRSKNAELRAFCFLYGIMLFNAWVMINVQRALQDGGDPGQWDGTPPHNPGYNDTLRAAAHPG